MEIFQLHLFPVPDDHNIVAAVALGEKFRHVVILVYPSAVYTVKAVPLL